MIRIYSLAFLLILVSSTACTRRMLAPTFAKTWKNILAAQTEGRSSRALAPVKGDESRRIIKAYYSGLSGDSGGGSDQSSSAAASSSSGMPASGPSSSGGNPFAFKVR